MRSIITYLGHAAVLIKSEAGDILIDPFLSGNPDSPVKPDKVNPKFILVTHGHGDHLGDTVEIAKRSGALVIAPYELGTYIGMQGVRNVHTMHIGGTFTFPFGKLTMTIAHHGSAVIKEGEIIYTGNPCGYVIKLKDRTIYHAGDTSLFMDMELIGERNKITVALLPIGGNYTMDIDDAVYAVNLLKPEVVIPMHYSAFPVIKKDPEEFKRRVEEETKSRCIVLKPGESY